MLCTILKNVNRYIDTAILIANKKKAARRLPLLLPSYEAQRPFDRSFWIAASCATAAAISAWAFA